MSERTTALELEDNVITRHEKNSLTDNVFYEFNKVFVSGKIGAELEYSHKIGWKKFYKTKVIVKRLSGTEDIVPIVISCLLIERERKRESLVDKWVEVVGSFMSRNKIGQDGKKHLELFIFATEFNVFDYEDELKESPTTNLVYLEGNLGKEPIFRRTPLGRQISDFLIVVDRTYDQSYYIPCIAWGRNALEVSEFSVGDRIQLYGRIQSREYLKRISPDSEIQERRVAYEVSTIKVQKVEDLVAEE